MREKAATQPPKIAFGDEIVVMTRTGQSRKIVAQVLGQEVCPETGLKSVWLDRLIHRPNESTMVGDTHVWSVTGAISTVLVEQSTA